METKHEVRFRLGQIVATPGALDALQRNNVTAFDYLRRHASGDWGVLDQEDKQANEEATKSGARLMSAYLLPDETKVWVITEATDEAGNRMATTLLLPDEY